MSLSLKISGDPAALRVAAHWLGEQLRPPLLDADLELSSMVGDAVYIWTGESGSAFNSAAQAVRQGNFAVPSYVGDVAEVLRAYAGRLERGADDFHAIAAYAVRKGLTVSGDVIHVPTTSLKFCPAPDAEDSPEVREWNTYQDKVTVYQELSGRVGRWWGELDVWVAEQFGALVAGMESLQEASTVYEGLVNGNEEVVGFALDYAHARQTRNLDDFRAHVSDMQHKADVFREQLKSGNPALRAAATKADPRGLSRSADVLSEMIEGVSKTSKIIPIAGTAVDIVSTGVEIANGGSESSAIVGFAAGFGGGVAGGAGVVGLATIGIVIPPVGVAFVVGGLAVGASAAGSAAWEAWVPLDTREAIDAGVEDFFEFANPVSWFVDAP